jgi:hypothetical protein
MATKNAPGDVHEPIEDLEVSFGLKVLVIMMFLALFAAIVAIVTMIG